MPGCPDSPEEDGCMNSGEKRSVEPATALADELWERFRDVRLRDRALDIFEDPVVSECVSFRTASRWGRWGLLASWSSVSPQARNTRYAAAGYLSRCTHP